MSGSILSTIRPPENTRTLPSVAETTTPVAAVRAVTAAAAACRAPKPAGSSTSTLKAARYTPAGKNRGHSIFPLSSIYFSLLLQMLKCSKDLRIHLSCKKASTSSASFSPPSTSSDKACRRTLCVSVTHIRDPNCCYRPQAFLIHAMSSEGGPVFVPPGVVSLLRP